MLLVNPYEEAARRYDYLLSDKDLWELEWDEPEEPTKKPIHVCHSGPGSSERLKELARRFEAGEELWHEDDQKTCFSMPIGNDGKTYAQERSGLSLRTRGNGRQDWFVSVHSFGFQLIKRFRLRDHDLAIDFLNDAKKGCIPGMREVVTCLIEAES